MALCAIVVAGALTQASPSLGYGAGTPSVIVDLSAIDQAVSARRIWPQPDQHQRLAGHDRPAGLRGPALDPPPLNPPSPAAVSPQAPLPSAPLPGSAAFYALFPPPPPVPADTRLDEAAPLVADGAVVPAAELSASAALAPLPVARPAAPGRSRFAAPAPRRSAMHAAAATVAAPAIRPVPHAAPYAAARTVRAELSPAAKPKRPLETGELGQRVRLRLPYPVAGTDLSPSAQAELEALVAEVGSDDRVRLRLAAYANAGAGSLSKARRISLTRALAVRSFLIERGIKASRIDLRALGNMAGPAEADRVDVAVGEK